MLCMKLLEDQKKVEICAEHGFSEDILVYHCPAAGFDNYVFFAWKDYCLFLYKVVDNPADPLIFDFLVKGALGYGEQHMALDVDFSCELDDAKLRRFGFLKDENVRRVRLWTLGGGCAGCSHSKEN